MASTGIAFLYAVKGDHDEALEWLAQAAESRGPEVLINARNAPELEGFRSDPRFDELLGQYGFAEHQLAAIRFQVALPE